MHPRVEPASQVDHAAHHVLAVPPAADLLGHAVQHLLGGRDAGGRDKDEECDERGAAGRQRPNPGTLAEAPQSEPLHSERFPDRQRILRLDLEMIDGWLPIRRPFASAIEGRDADTDPPPNLVKVPIERVVAHPLRGTVDGDHRRGPGGRVRDSQRGAVDRHPQVAHGYR
jgi:hypothetical protein